MNSQSQHPKQLGSSPLLAIIMCDKSQTHYQRRDGWGLTIEVDLMKTLSKSLIILVVSSSPVLGQMNDAFVLTENFAKDRQYHVSCQVDISGSLPIGTKPSEQKLLQVSGKSTIQYDERILRLTSDRLVDRTVRYYRQMAFQRKIGTEEQNNELRPEARRLVILRHKQYEVPFCPAGPLTWGEIDLVRTDVFVPALRGLLPPQPVRPGDRWNADLIAIQELTDLEKIDKAQFVCTFEKVTTLLGKRNAHVNFEGTVQGVGEDGNALHEMRGSFYVDLDDQFLCYLYVKGTHHLLGKDGKGLGKIEGSFVMTRSRAPLTGELSDAAIRGLELEPNADNTLLLFDQPQLGVRLLYPRNWRVAGANGQQIGIDEKHGSGMLITLATAATTPTGAQFRQETFNWLTKNQAKILREEKVRTLQPGLETFSFEGEVERQKVVLQYYVLRQGSQGATIAVRTTPEAVNAVRPDIDRIMRSLQLRAPSK
jgi:hypothetical protein